MLFLTIRTIGLLLLSVVLLALYLRHRKNHGRWIKRKAVRTEEALAQQTWEKRIDVLVLVGLVLFAALVTAPCCLDVPYLVSGRLVEVRGEVTQGSVSGENTARERRVHVRQDGTGQEHSLKYWGAGLDRGATVTVRYLPHTEYGYVIEQRERVTGKSSRSLGDLLLLSWS